MGNGWLISNSLFNRNSRMGINILLVGLGGGAGSILRYLCQKWVNESYHQNFPLATFLVNLSGCFLIGIFYAMGEKGNILSPQTRLLLVTGFCGGFTTFSTFTYEGIQLIMEHRWMTFLLYTLLSVAAGLVATYFGYKLTS